MEAITEKQAKTLNGFLMLFIILLIMILNVFLFINSININEPMHLIFIIPIFLFTFIMLGGLTIIHPNESRVLILFGRYSGTIKESGFWWVNPFNVKTKVSLRIHNFLSEKIKVNDLHGNPIEIAAVIVWRVVDSAKAIFDVQNYEQFVSIQSETAIRSIASQYSYDSHDEKMSLVGNQNEIAEELKQQTQKRLEIAGIKIVETRISYLAYAPEIAQAMLRRQQAQAVVAARTKIVEGAVGMVEMALKALSEQNIIQLDNEKKATMVNNLLVALVSEVQAQPVINTSNIH
ncbi:MAG: SPFH domain-containing protein [Melioribacteraceae bacterium]|nr:SPFH domain-containing protein [Melioribacteraceae bacterium]